MGKKKQGYNAKARQSIRNLGKSNPNAWDDTVAVATPEANAEVDMNLESSSDPNAFMIIPETKEEKERRKEELRQQLREQQPEMSQKKKKRLEKYIEKKLKKEERVVLFEKLSKSAWSSELMKSSKEIGRPKETMREKLRRAVNEQKSGLPLSNPDVPLFKEVEVSSLDNDEQMDEEDEVEKISKGSSLDERNIASKKVEAEKKAGEPAKEDIPSVIVGGALKRKADGLPVPLVKKKKKKKKSTIPAAVRARFHKPRPEELLGESDEDEDKRHESEVESDDSFDSSNSEYDTDKEEMKEDEEEAKSTEHEETRKKEMESDADGIKITENKGGSLAEMAAMASKPAAAPPTPSKTEMEKPKTVSLSTPTNSTSEEPTVPKKTKFYVTVNRPPELQEARLKLPVCGEEQVIMDAITHNPVVIICGETGSGKTTQVPQFLYEAGYGHAGSDNPGMVGITQPRRVAAVSMAKRVAQELGVTEETVSHQIRYDTTVSPDTKIKFMTDGVLLRELATDFLLSRYSAIIIDEAHERSLNTDILIGVVSRVLRLREEMSKENPEKVKPLRIIIMSATLRVEDFTSNRTLFDTPPPILKVDARQYPVTMHFNKRTQADYVTEAFRKVCKIHARLPAGGILVFLTGQNEISVLCKKLRKRYPMPQDDKKTNLKQSKKDEDIEKKSEKVNPRNTDVELEELAIGENEDFEDFDSDESDVDIQPSDDEAEVNTPLHVLPLYSLLPTSAQMRVFQPPPEGTRLCVVATNVAETSLTIPDIKYVVDCGRVKERQYDPQSGVQSFEIGWTSKASADQRAGRAGRTQAGHCYRLYSSAVFDNEFQKFSIPEINRIPIEGVVLQMKAMNIDNVMNFPFPSPPDRSALKKAEQLLVYLSALESDSKRITEVGRTMSMFPLAPRFSKMLTIGSQHGCLPYVITVVAALSVGDPFVQDYNLDSHHPEDDNEEDEDAEELSEIRKEEVAEKARRKINRKKYYETQLKYAGTPANSDILKLLNVVGAYEFGGASDAFCDKNFLRLKAMQEIRKLRNQITQLVQTNCPGVDVCIDPKMRPPTDVQRQALRQILAAGFIDQVAVRKDLVADAENEGTGKKRERPAYVTLWSDEEAFIHPTSILHRQAPDFVVYNELFKTSRVWLKGVTEIEGKWLAKLGRVLCSYSKPPTPRLTEKRKEIDCYVTPYFGPKAWPLPSVPALQKRVGTRWTFELKR
ncbi:uncharacterized protein VTP21DRAFT_8667 [Calcarisporiella thermophila]|uniref:uncharacterized protein n=1 Tax=Calcarisporiella thermophila TaxID=911321 RepID=UPI003743DE28